MSESLSKVFIFVTGAAVGAVATWIVMDKKCKLLEEDVDSAREFYLANREESEVTIAETRAPEPKPDINEYINKVNDLGYSNSDEEKEDDDKNYPYVIEPDEYGCGYEEKSLTYWADGILSDDEDDSIIEDIETVFGIEVDLLDQFDENGVIHIRNDELKTDYEVVKYSRTYAESIDRSELED